MSKMSDLHIEMQESGEIVQCPACEHGFYTPYGVTKTEIMPPYPALSRRDNKTYICSPCGNREAFEDFERVYGIKIEEA
jgi:hypothetical protein